MTQQHALIIDDEPDVITYLESLLSDRGWETRGTTSANEGLQMAHERAPDVILLDIMMPERGGLSTLVALRKDRSLQSVPVVFVTAVEEHVHNIYDREGEKSFQKYLDRIKSYRADGFLEKPIDPERLFSVLDEVTRAA